jgi:hypothetical protein
MKKTVFLLTFLLCYNYCISQNTAKLDSLRKELSNHKVNDSIRFELLIETFNLEFKHNLDSALVISNEAYSLSKILKNRRYEALALIHQAMYFGKNKLYDSALKLALEASGLSQTHSPKEEQIFIKSELSSYYRVTNETDKALEIMLEIIDLVEKNQASSNKARYYFEVGNTYGSMEDYTNAQIYFIRAMKISEEVEYTPGIMASKSALMEVYYMNNDLNALYKVYNELYTFYISSEDHLKLNKIKMFKGFGLVKEHKYIQALSFLEKAYIGSNRIGDIQSKKRIAEKLITTHTALQNFEKADEFDKVYRQLQDSLDNDKRLLLTEELKEKYETEKITQEKEQAEINEQFAQELAVKNRKLFIASIIGSASLLFLALIFIYQIQLKKRAELSEAKLSESENRLQLERKLNDAEMKALRSQMNPHFLFNAFNSIQEFIILNDRELASDYLGKFADLMRLYLDQSKEKLISLENEISTTSLYLELEKIRFEETLTCEIKVAKDIDTTMKELPPMLIQPFIENSLKHGLFHKKENRQLKVNFTLENQTLICTIADNGIGRKQSAILNANRLKKHKSFATSATQNRIELLNVGRSEDITLHIFDLIDDKGKALGTRVEIKIPKHESNNY